MPIPADNPLTVEGVALGRLLFHDPILSADSTLSCAGCHEQSNGFGDPRRFSIGVTGEAGERQAPTLINLAWLRRGMFWDGRAASLEEQALGPVENPIEMNLSWDEAESRLNAHADYPDLFDGAFGTKQITRDLVVKAIAQFERILVSNGSRFDRWLVGEIELSEAELRGKALFYSEAADCFHCHGDQRYFTDEDYHNAGLDSISADPGLAGISGNPADHGAFKTPTLRNIEYSGPYMHDGRFTTLEEVIEHYVDGWHRSPTLDPIYLARDTITVLMTEPEQADLLAFLLTLSDPGFAINPEFANPFED